MDAIRTINITFGNAKRQAERLNDCSDQLQKIRQQIDALRGNLQRDWSGEAANAFLAKCDVLQEKINNTSTDISRIAGVIRSAANAYYSAEMKAIEIANTRG